MKQRFVCVVLVMGAAAGALASGASAAFPGANGKIAFSACGATDCGIFLVDPDGSDATQITHNPYTRSDRFGTVHLPDEHVAWSAQGDRITFERYVPFGNPEIAVANADGSDVRSLGVPGNDPAWSPAGRIAFWQFGGSEGSAGIYVMDADGSNVVRVHQGFNPRNPDWSPDGTAIAYFDRRDQGFGDPEIWVVPAVGGTPTSLTPPDFSQGSASPRFVNTDPSWAPDGTQVVYSASIPGRQKDLYTVGADGSDKVRLTTTDTDLTGPSEEGAAWSPDGTQIAYGRSQGDVPSGILVMTADGSQHTFIHSGNSPAWQPLRNNPPDCLAVRATPSSLGAPNHRFLTVTLSGAPDPDGDTVDVEITGVTQDEAVRRPGAIPASAPNRVQLRAERDPKGDGRVYRIAFIASDGRGGTCTGVATASVRKGNQAIDSSPPSYDSFGS